MCSAWRPVEMSNEVGSRERITKRMMVNLRMLNRSRWVMWFCQKV